MVNGKMMNGSEGPTLPHHSLFTIDHSPMKEVVP
jgi:hypothetical protein